MKYIIKNCPNKPSDCKAIYGWCGKEKNHCQNVEDCITKLVIKKCQDVLGYVDYKTYFIRNNHSLKQEAYKALYDILQMFDIEEFNEKELL